MKRALLAALVSSMVLAGCLGSTEVVDGYTLVKTDLDVKQVTATIDVETTQDISITHVKIKDDVEGFNARQVSSGSLQFTVVTTCDYVPAEVTVSVTFNTGEQRSARVAFGSCQALGDTTVTPA